MYEEFFKRERIPVEIICDGGVVGKNPSDFGGTYGWVAIDNEDEIVFQGSGFHKTEGQPTTNNHTEYIAAIHALEAMPVGWSGTFTSDSQITLGRLFSGWKTKNLPDEYVIRANKALKRLGKVTPKHVKGHVTKQEMEDGISKKGHAVSKWNDYVDDLCQKESKKIKGIL